MASFFETKIEFLKGIGPQKAALLQKELQIFTFGDLIQHFPYRYEDRTQIYQIATVSEEKTQVQLKGKILYIEQIGAGAKRRLKAVFSDGTGQIELLWFRGIPWILKSLKIDQEYIVYGKPTWFNSQFSIAHPELEILTKANENGSVIQPIYSTTEKLKNAYLDSKGISKCMFQLLQVAYNHIQETLPRYILEQYKLMPKPDAIKYIHFPSSEAALSAAQYRLKFEELFYAQLKIGQTYGKRRVENKGLIVQEIPTLHRFYNEVLPFKLTEAQKKVLKEIRADLKTGIQMNRLLQGDVGSGKTIVAFMTMLMVIDNQAQACLIAPTEILADQHYASLLPWCEALDIQIVKLKGSTKKSERESIQQGLQDGTIKIIVGTHALLMDNVQFKNLGLCIIDEQHKFGVAQRAKLWQKNNMMYPHILVMTATPIPRTLAMAFYGDLDVSVIDELPEGRKTIKTIHRFENQRLAVYGFLKEEIAKGRQVYIVYPLIEESEKMDLANLYQGYDEICKEFPRPFYQVCVIHGKMQPKDKEAEMQRFIKNQAQIMVATTVIEVGVNVPNASVMVIENAERFGLSQLHQLRGRVGRGAEQSYCILMTGNKLSHESREKLQTLVKSNNGFEIAEADLKLRGPGDIMGTQQSGMLDLMVADLSKDQEILKTVRPIAFQIAEQDPGLEDDRHALIRKQINSISKNTTNWSRIS